MEGAISLRCHFHRETNRAGRCERKQTGYVFHCSPEVQKLRNDANLAHVRVSRGDVGGSRNCSRGYRHDGSVCEREAHMQAVGRSTLLKIDRGKGLRLPKLKEEVIGLT
jgi:hypothetical protein